MKRAGTFSLERAIQDQHLALFYQPRVSSASGQIIGAEALLRWNEDGTGWCGVSVLEHFSKDEFATLWLWKLEQVKAAFHKIRNWVGCEDSNLSFVVSLNLSHKQLHTYEWATRLLHMLEVSNIPTSCVEIELTEHHGCRDPVVEESSFEMVRAAGIALTLDDFPEGGQSFLRIARFRFDKIKIDRSLVPESSDSAKVWLAKRELLSALLGIIDSVGARSVIEGIENEVHYNFLKGLPVDEWQGYYWGRPMQLTELLQLLPRAGSLQVTRSVATTENGPRANQQSEF